MVLWTLKKATCFYFTSLKMTHSYDIQNFVLSDTELFISTVSGKEKKLKEKKVIETLRSQTWGVFDSFKSRSCGITGSSAAKQPKTKRVKELQWLKSPDALSQESWCEIKQIIHNFSMTICERLIKSYRQSLHLYYILRLIKDMMIFHSTWIYVSFYTEMQFIVLPSN